MFAWKPVVSLLFCFVLLISALLIPDPPPAAAQDGCALIINEIMYYPGPGLSAIDEWVELYVAADITTDTTYFITDQDTASAGDFELSFTIPAGTVLGTYVMIHNDGDPSNNGITSTVGIHNNISFFMGNPDVNLRVGGDEIVLYEGSDESGTPCDYVAYLTPNTPDVPSGFSWNNSTCSNPGGVPAGTSISLDPNGLASNDACDWAESGQHSPNHPDPSITGAPDTKGYNNNTTPTAVSLASFTVTQNSSGGILFTLLASLLTAGTLWAGVIRGRGE